MFFPQTTVKNKKSCGKPGAGNRRSWKGPPTNFHGFPSTATCAPLCMNSPSSCFKELELSAAPAGVAVVNFSGTRWLYRSGELDEAPRKGSRRSSSNAAASSAASAAASANPGTALAVHFNDSADDRGTAGGGEAGRGSQDARKTQTAHPHRLAGTRSLWEWSM